MHGFSSESPLVFGRGQGYPSPNAPPYFGPSKKLDFELEMVSVFPTCNKFFIVLIYQTENY